MNHLCNCLILVRRIHIIRTAPRNAIVPGYHPGSCCGCDQSFGWPGRRRRCCHAHRDWCTSCGCTAHWPRVPPGDPWWQWPQQSPFRGTSPTKQRIILQVRFGLGHHEVLRIGLGGSSHRCRNAETHEEQNADFVGIHLHCYSDEIELMTHRGCSRVFIGISGL